MSKRTKNKYKSNLGVYLIAFVVTAVALTLAVILLWNRFMHPTLEANTVAVGDDRPDASLSANVLFLLSESKGAAPEQFLLLNYRPHDNKMLAVPLRPNTLITYDGGKKSTLADLYRSGGSMALVHGVSSTFGIDCKYYVKFDRDSFVEFVGIFGNVPVDVPKDVVDYGVSGAADTSGVGGTGSDNALPPLFSAGTYALSADKLYAYLAVKGDGGDDKYNAQGSAAVSIINNCARNLTVSVLTNLFTIIQNNADSNFRFDDYTNYQKAFLYTTTHISESASFYLPYGDVDENGNFVIATQSVSVVQSRFRADGA